MNFFVLWLLVVCSEIFSELQLSNGENRGATGTGLGYVINPMLKVLDEMYRAQDDLARYM
jgi:hypothetical protein